MAVDIVLNGESFRCGLALISITRLGALGNGALGDGGASTLGDARQLEQLCCVHGH